jgi:iron complex transport system substrate-binding protein
MKLSRRAFLLASCLAALPLRAQAAPRVVVLGGAIAEIVVALGAYAALVGRDSTSTYPASLLALPDVGYVRALSAEGVLSLAPDLILAEPDAGPPAVVEVLKASGARFATIPGTPDAEGVLAKIAATAAALGREAEGERLIGQVRADLAEARAMAASVTRPVSVLFVLSLQGGSVRVGGEGSSAEGIIRLAGGTNAASGFSGYKPMTDEAVLAAKPEVIIVMDREGELSITPEMILGHPALGQTEAARANRIVAMDGLLLLGFGPRTGQAALALHKALYETAQ